MIYHWFSLDKTFEACHLPSISQLWDVGAPPVSDDLRGPNPLVVLREHSKEVSSVCWSAMRGAPQHLLSASWDGLVKVWDVPVAGDIRRSSLRTLSAQEGQIYSAQWSPRREAVLASVAGMHWVFAVACFGCLVPFQCKLFCSELYQGQWICLLYCMQYEETSPMSRDFFSVSWTLIGCHAHKIRRSCAQTCYIPPEPRENRFHSSRVFFPLRQTMKETNPQALMKSLVRSCSHARCMGEQLSNIDSLDVPQGPGVSLRPRPGPCSTSQQSMYETILTLCITHSGPDNYKCCFFFFVLNTRQAPWASCRFTSIHWLSPCRARSHLCG